MWEQCVFILPKSVNFSSFYSSQLHNDNILLFTDGMANEGFTEAEELIREIQKKKQLVRQECRYPEDYSIKIATLGNVLGVYLQFKDITAGP